ncbi:MAG: DUF2314 domain-containing protein [Planctomycetota bacterium]
MAALCTASAPAQEVAPPSPAAAPPGYVLLRAESEPLSLAKVRRRVAALRKVSLGRVAVDGTDWLAAADAADPAAGLIGELDGVPFRVVAHAEPFELGEPAIAHLLAEEQEALRGQSAFVVVERRGPAGDDLDADYRALGPVAAALLDGALGVGTRQHGTFEVAGGHVREGLLAHRPLRALQPNSTDYLVVFVDAPRKLSEVHPQSVLRPAACAADGSAASDQGMRVRVRDGVGFLAFEEVSVSLMLGPALEFDIDGMDLRTQRLVERHRGRLLLVATGAPGPEHALARQRALGRVAAALWGDDCLGVTWSCDAELLPMHDRLLSQLRADDPVAATLAWPASQVFVPEDRAAMDAAIAEARRTWNQALARLAAGGDLLAKFPFATDKGGKEHIWIDVLEVKDGEVRGTCDSDPVDVPGLKRGDEVRRKVVELSDWLFYRDGEMVGGVTVKLMQPQIQRGRRSK